jgi:diguanylate cyclase (GGDEF)-like protein
MTLNNRTGLLIFPVIVLGYSVAFLGVYDALKKMIIELETTATAVQVAEIADSLMHYSVLVDQYFFIISQHHSVQSLLATPQADLRSQREADTAIANIGIAQRHQLSIAAIGAKGAVEYFYGDSREFTSEFDLRLANWVGGLAEQGQTEATEMWSGDQAMMVRMRLVDRQTMQMPDPTNFGDAVALIVAIDPPGFKRQVAALVGSGKTVEWSHFGHELSKLSDGAISAEDVVPAFGTLRVAAPAAWVEPRLSVIRWLLGLAFVVLAALSYMALRWLLWRYITQPIASLKREFTAIGYSDDEAQPLAFDSGDDIGSLSRAFTKMHQDLRQSYQIAREMGEKDGLTRLYNRRMFHYHIDRILQRAERAQGKVALLYIDVDNLKLINDRFGYDTGDELLRNFADRLSDVLRPGDVVASPVSSNCAARLAGDEFAVILYDYEDDDVPRRVAMRVFGICDQGYLIQSASVASSLSIGVACFPADASNATELISSADTAMVQAKSKGNNQYSFYSRPLAKKALRTAEIEVALAVLPYAEFQLYYMPIVCASSGQVSGVEALLRWKSKSLGWVSPEEFIPVAESTGAFRGIDRWVINQASADVPALVACFGSGMHVSVNISAAELASSEFVNEVSAMVQQGFISSANIELEITETFHLNRSVDGEEMLGQLRELGFAISIDDFGTGYTSLVQLVEYPIDKIKLDRTFLNKVIQRDRISVVKSLVDFCKSQDFAVTAEGIETMDQVVALTEAGCDYLQGYFYSPALPLDELIFKYANEADIELESSVANVPLRLAVV